MRIALSFVLIAWTIFARADPFTVTARLERAATAWQVTVNVEVPARHVLYADQRFAVLINDKALPGRIFPAPVFQSDPAGQQESVFTSRVEAVYVLPDVSGPVLVKVERQGCSDTSCYLPRTVTFELSGVAELCPPVLPKPSAIELEGGALRRQAGLAPPSSLTVPNTSVWLDGVRITDSTAGYLGSSDFLDFLARSRGTTSTTPRNWFRQFIDDPVAFLAKRGISWTLLLMLLGGLLLNLTPCVLPMIPINLAIIGAGARAGSRTRGLALGAAYGAGIALVYGALGLVVVLTGSVFGALQSSPIFNGIMAALFLVLALAMFDVLPIDLSRFQRNGAGRGGFVTAGVAGGVSALLAGACVAPVVAAVLLLSASLYHAGTTAAVLLPFMLGVGMALPWPFTGAGMAVLPKPGAWMVWVKNGFGVLIAVMGIYYGWLTYTGITTSMQMGSGSRGRSPSSSIPNGLSTTGGRAASRAAMDGTELMAGDVDGWTRWLAESKTERKPLLVDFHASWCKDCEVMDRTTFRDPAVRKALENFIVVRVATERPAEEPALGMCQALGITGLPTFLVVVAR